MTGLRPGDELPTRTLVARNTSAHEAGSVHDDAHAARLGYRGGLVPGVTLLAYLTPTLVDAFGVAWPERGRLRARFVRPAYDGDTLAVSARVERVDGADVTLACAVAGPDGARCVEAGASCDPRAGRPEREPWRRGIPTGRVPAPGPSGALPPLDPATLAVGQELSPLTYRLTLEESSAWAAEAGDGSDWYRDASPFGGPIVHPAMFARDAVHLIRHNFAYKATLHAASDLAYRHAGRPDRDYTVFGYVAEVYERKGNWYLVLDTITVDQDGREIVRNAHTSVITLRGE